jgi:regulatory protein YycH of two-component signal transduction system YycFG
MNWLKWITHTRKIITLFRDNYEHIKSISLTVLILLSLILTWSLWTFKPSHPTLQDARTVKKQMVEVEEQLELSDVVYPTQIVYHKGDELYGVEASDIIENFHKQLNKTKFTFETNSKNDQIFDPNEKFLSDNEYIEVIYPAAMTQEVYKEVFSFETENISSKPPNVDRIFLYQNNPSSNIEGYLVSYQSMRKQKIKAIDNDALSPLMKNVDKFLKEGEFVPYISHDLEERTHVGDVRINDRLYFPKYSIHVNRNAYISRAVNEDTKDKYKKALFKDPLSVKSATTNTNEITFTDGTALMVINELQNRFTYTNFAGPTDGSMSVNSPLFQSIDYINTHAGWGGRNKYILSHLSSSSAGFWLHVDELPVLDSEMQMSLSWNENELYQYQRSMIELDIESPYYPEEISEPVSLPSGQAVVNELIESDYNINYIKDVRIGFTMRRQSEPHVYFLEPKWFIYFENKGWYPLFKKDREEGF